MRDYICELTNDSHLFANCGFVGINSEMETSEGYDGTLYPSTKKGRYRDWTKEDRVIVAEHMIALWERFKEEGVSNDHWNN